MILHSCVYSLEISCTTGHTDFTMTNFFYKFKGSHAKNCAGKKPYKNLFFFWKHLDFTNVDSSSNSNTSSINGLHFCRAQNPHD